MLGGGGRFALRGDAGAAAGAGRRLGGPGCGKVLSGGKRPAPVHRLGPSSRPRPALSLAHVGQGHPGLGGAYSTDPDPTVPGEVGVTPFVGRGNFLTAPLGQKVGSRGSGCEQIPAGHM